MKKLLILLLLVLAGAGGAFWFLRSRQAKQDQTTGPNVIFITVDTLRADHTPFGSYERRTMANTEKFFSNGIRFVQAETVRSRTTPSYDSMLTGLFPYHHGVRDLYDQLNPQITTLQEILKKNGYLTIGFVSSFVMIGRFSGISQGFDFYDDYVDTKQVSRESYERRAEDTLAKTISWLKNRKSNRPFFLFIHLIDPHGPYDPPGTFKTAFHSNRTEVLTKQQIPSYQFFDGQFDRYQYIDRYDGEILYLDQQLGKLYPALENLRQNSWILFIGDHGESQGEHQDYFNHGKSCYEAETRIPMVWLPPAGLNPGLTGRAITQPVSVVDVAPTVLDALHISSGAKMDGESLLPLMQGKQPRSPYRFYERLQHKQEVYAIRDSRLKIIAERKDDQFVYSVYDLSADPLEEKDLAATTPPPPEMLKALQSYIQDSQQTHLPFTVQSFPKEVMHAGSGRKKYIEDRGKQPSEEDIEKLRALGYVD